MISDSRQIPAHEFQNCCDELCHQVRFFHFSFHRLAHPVRSSGHISTTQSLTPPKSNSSTKSPLTNNTSQISANQHFADAILENYQEREIICVNDYHLMLLPNLLRSSPKLPRAAPIGSSCASPFPLPKYSGVCPLDRTCSTRLAWADLVGFLDCQLRTPLPTDCFRRIGVRGCPRGSKYQRFTLPKRRAVASSETGWANERGSSTLVCFLWESTSSSSNYVRKQT